MTEGDVILQVAIARAKELYNNIMRSRGYTQEEIDEFNDKHFKEWVEKDE